MVQPRALSFDKGDRGWQAVWPRDGSAVAAGAQRGHTGSRDKPLYCGWHFRVKFQCGLGTSRLYLL